ncbi:DUF6894 family protein [Methylobacterium oxalidis]|uniref:DUF6894 domain-containing protein n=1 Tax=Methylobacterium oxalidis TaxID=944322 RepID=A0A512J4B9_9HYPH|nr:hypothetical protein [Methylobacterium oxalidis]GEP04806.1 hypothetical protein MOX02_28440 [Methylobacterium oxalidis]GJE30506.1 hypothetical protein LDDCCGHA_0674 [Methylobacterium oxalidis]GLS63632.1 hypothetical protein GCM10007888_20130 [Methylobacterium oxalidis]
MPRYFFDVHDSGPQFDDRGTVLAGPDEACAKAKSLLASIAHEDIPKGADQHTFMAQVRDEDGNSIYAATLTYSGIRSQRQRHP